MASERLASAGAVQYNEIENIRGASPRQSRLGAVSMHVVECPHCHRQFRVPEAVTSARMKCSRCGQSFVGSSTEMPGAEAVPAKQRPPVGPARSSAAGPAMLVICCVAAAGIVVLAVVFYWIRTHPVIVVKREHTGKVMSKDRMPRREAEREMERLRRAGAGHVRPAAEGPPDRLPPLLPAATRPAGAQPPAEVVGDLKLMVGAPALVEAGAVGERKFACGTILSKYDVALRQVSVTAYVDGRRGSSRYYPYVPAGGTVRYCVPLEGQDLDAERVRIVALAERVKSDLVVWAIPAEQIKRAVEAGDVAAWTGRIRNPGAVPLRDIKIILDYYDDEGIWGGRADGKMEDRTTLGIRRSGFFRVTTRELNAREPITSSIVVARAVAQKF